MKHLHTFYVLLLCFSCESIIAQAPQSIPYQAVARDNSGLQISNQAISLRFSIHDLTAGGTVVYKETQTATTNTLGLFSVNIGQGTVVTGTFSAINWGSGFKFMQVELDATGGTNYTDMGTQQILSVPYALYSNSSGGTAGGDLSGTYPNPTVAKINGSALGTTTGAGTGQVLKWNGTNWSSGNDSTGGAAGGDLSGSYPNPAVVKLNGSPLGTTTGASTGQVLKWNGTNWSSGTDNNSGGTVTSVTAGSGLSGGTITTSGTISMPNVGTAGTYGSETQIPVITTDSKGRVSGVSFADNSHADTILTIGEGDFFCKLSSDVITRFGGFGASLPGSDDGNLYAPVHLPHHATVTKITIYYIDDHSIYNQRIRFFRRDLVNFSETDLVSFVTSGRNGVVRTMVWNTSIVIDNAYSYYVNIVPDNINIWPPNPDQCGIVAAKFEYHN